MWKNLRNLVFGGIASKLLLGVSNIFLIKTLLKPDFALLSNFLYIQSMVSGLLFSPFLLAAVPVANLNKIQNYNRFFSALNWFQMAFLSFLFGFACLYGPDLSIDLFHKPEFYPSIILGLLASIVMTFQNIMLSKQQTKEAFGTYNLINLVRPSALLGVLLLLYFFDALNFRTAAVSFLISIVVSLLVDFKGFSALFNHSGYLLKLNQFVWYWRYAWMLILFFFIRGTYDHVAFFFVSRYFDIESIANFSVPFRYYSMFDLIILTSHIAFINSFTKDGLAPGLDKLKKWVKYTSVLACLGLIFLPFSKDIFILISGSKYEVSFPFFCIFMVGLIPYLCFSPAIYGVIANHGIKFLFGLRFLILLIHFALCWLGSTHQSLEIIAFSTVLSRGLIYLCSIIYLLRKA